MIERIIKNPIVSGIVCILMGFTLLGIRSRPDIMENIQITTGTLESLGFLALLFGGVFFFLAMILSLKK